MGSIAEPWGISESENANYGTPKGLSRELRHGKTAHNMSSSSLRKKSDLRLIQKVPCKSLQNVLSNLQEVILGTKLAVLFLAIPLAVIADYYHYGRVSSSFIPLCQFWLNFPEKLGDHCSVSK
uniref:Uncharacterized protein n=1 Tax=Brassica oleracea var. oleracea TaxID=109376 RepID=A0A0D3DE25_BRAOL